MLSSLFAVGGDEASEFVRAGRVILSSGLMQINSAASLLNYSERMKWHPRYATGNAQIDEQHRMLFETSDQFRETLEAGRGAETYDLFLEFLVAYTKVHFGHEEGCMMAHKCPVAGRNKSEHGLFIKLLEKENTRFNRDGFVAASAIAFLDKVDQWIDSHICRIDVQLRSVLS